MKTHTALVTLFALASFPLLAQQSSPASQPNSPAAQQSSPQQDSPEGAPAATSPAAATPAAPAIEMSSVKGQLVSKLDSKTAKTGDSVVIQTNSSVKTADGAEIPKGSKLMGHVVGAQSSGAGENSQVALLFDHVELKGGQSLTVHSQIQSIAPAAGAASSSDSSAAAAPSAPGAGGAPQGQTAVPGAASGAAASGSPAPGTIVAKTGNIAIQTTSIPGVLLANNAPGQQDPRMAQASSILLGAKRDIQLDGGTQVMLGVATTTSGAGQ
jgi:hypothetical protein